MSKPVFEDLFRASQRRNRLSYLLYTLAFAAAGAGVALLMLLVVGGAERAAGIALTLAFMPIYAAMCVSGLLVAAQRCRDFGWSGWAALIVLLPVVGWLFALALYVAPGTPGENRYGADPIGGFPNLAHLPAE